MLTRLYIDGVWQDGARGRTMPVHNPANEAVLAHVAVADADDVERAVDAAARAFKTWRHTSGADRGRYLRAVAKAVEAQAEALARLQSLNNGKPLAEARIDVADVASTFAYYATLAEGLDESSEQAVDLPVQDFDARVRREPAGVAALIVPWNFPMVTTAWKLAPALAAGCTVVLKPSEVTPLPELALMGIIADVGLPAGVVNVVNGPGAEIGGVLTTHPGVSKVSFTGSNAVGRIVMKAAAETVKGVSLELGGKSAILVFEDADIDQAVDLVTGGIFFNAGQMCSATSRLLVARELERALLDRLVDRAHRIVVGDPFAQDVQMGPLINRAQYERVLRYVRQGVEDGARLLAGGARPERCGPQGYYISPTIFTDVPANSALWREEIFGPVLCVRAFDTEADAIELANDSPYGLAATVVTSDTQRARRVAQRLDAGVVWVNAPQVIFPQTSWGGFKQSSLGRELGPWGMHAFQEIKSVVSARG
ncbi:aldehyde dehydrogenase [Pandoraea terrae]|uniref:Aldehyde dehydrogenase n=1 Tax=Pandoraea terrae TaxID=1537710 RepID=A0A5E4TJT5_9BURK|nr:aldehyde dehydrogenase family protein [Pandoraea terrae]VVD87512.1 aldehyde dehydrogenase [Pandoraea terrae]